MINISHSYLRKFAVCSISIVWFCLQMFWKWKTTIRTLHSPFSKTSDIFASNIFASRLGSRFWHPQALWTAVLHCIKCWCVTLCIKCWCVTLCMKCWCVTVCIKCWCVTLCIKCWCVTLCIKCWCVTLYKVLMCYTVYMCWCVTLCICVDVLHCV